MIESGRAEGLTLVPQTTNVLFDLILSGLFRALGAEAAQRIAVSLAVLVFVWGAFAFASVASGRRPWIVMPCIAMLAYGWVFHMGFFNFYLSLGLCLWAITSAWELRPRGIAGAAALMALAYTAHGLPVLWAGGLLAYVAVARRLGVTGRARLTGAVILAMAAAHLAIRPFMTARWSPAQWAESVGVDQLWLYDGKYYAAITALLLAETLLFVRLARSQGAKTLVSSIPFHLCAIAAAAVIVLPSAIFIPGYRHGLIYISERLSLGVGVCVCALLGAADGRRLERWAVAAAAIIFFGMVFRDERALNGLEDRMQQAVATVPAGERVIGLIFADLGLRANPGTHMIDRVCIGRCYSYGNYEPSTGQFRIRAVAKNRIVTADYGDSFRMQTGGYVVTERDTPLYAVDITPDGRVFVTQLPPGTKTGVTVWSALDDAPMR